MIEEDIKDIKHSLRVMDARLTHLILALCPIKQPKGE